MARGKHNTVYDTIIAGGGLWGMSIAYELAKSGKLVLVLEKNGEIGQGASAGHARMSKMDPRSQTYNELVAKSQQTIQSEFKDNPGILKPVNCFDICEERHPLRNPFLEVSYVKFLEPKAEGNPKARFGVTPESRKNMYAYTEQTYLLNPDLLLKSLKEKAIERGCKIITGEAVTYWKTSATNGVMVYTTENGYGYKADKMVIAAHGWSVDLLRKGWENGRKIKIDESILKDKKALLNVFTKRAPVWQFDFPEGVDKDAIGRSSLTGESYLDVYYLPEYSPQLGRIVMKVGMNSPRDREKHYNSPNDITRTISDKETAEVKDLVEQKFGIKLGEPLKKEICCMTYTKAPEGGFPVPMVGEFPNNKGIPINNITVAFAGCGVGAKLCPEIGSVVKRGMENRWQGEEIFTAYNPSRFSAVSKGTFAERIMHDRVNFPFLQPKL